jgi:hypothetical protein
MYFTLQPLLMTLALLIGLSMALPSAGGLPHPEGCCLWRFPLPWVTPTLGGYRSVGCAGLVYRDWSPGQPPHSMTHLHHLLGRITAPVTPGDHSYPLGMHCMNASVETAPIDLLPPAVQLSPQSWLWPPVSLGPAARAGGPKRIAPFYSKHTALSYLSAAERVPAWSYAALAAARGPVLESGDAFASRTQQQFLRLSAKTMRFVSLVGEIVVLYDPAAFIVGPDQPIALVRVLLSWLVTSLLLVLLCMQIHGLAEKRTDHESTCTGPQAGVPHFAPLDLRWVIASCTIRGRARLCKHKRGRTTHSTRRAFEIRGPSEAGDIRFFGEHIQVYCSVVRAKMVRDLWLGRCRGLGNHHAMHFCKSHGACPCITTSFPEPASSCHSLMFRLMHLLCLVRPAPRASCLSQACGCHPGWEYTFVARLLRFVLMPSYVLLLTVLLRCVELLNVLSKLANCLVRLVRLMCKVCLVMFFVYALLSVTHSSTQHTSSTNLPHTSRLGATESPNPNVSAVVMQQSSSVTLSFPASACLVNNYTILDHPVGSPAAFHAACASCPSPVRKLPSSSLSCILQCIEMPLGGFSIASSCCIPLGTLDRVARAALGSALNHTRWLSPGHWFPIGFAVAHPIHLFAGFFIRICNNWYYNALLAVVRSALLLAGAVMMLSVVAGNCNRFIAQHSPRCSKSSSKHTKYLTNIVNNIRRGGRKCPFPFETVSSTATHGHDPAQLDCLVRWIEDPSTSVPGGCPEPTQCSTQCDSAGIPPAGSTEPNTGSSSEQEIGAPSVRNEGADPGQSTGGPAGRCRGATDQLHADSAARAGNGLERTRQVSESRNNTAAVDNVAAAASQQAHLHEPIVTASETVTETTSETAIEIASATEITTEIVSAAETATEIAFVIERALESAIEHIVPNNTATIARTYPVTNASIADDDDFPLWSGRANRVSSQSCRAGDACTTSADCAGWVPEPAAQVVLAVPHCKLHSHCTPGVSVVCDSSPAPVIPTDPTDLTSERPVRVMMARGDSTNFPHILKITATKPLQLHDQIMEWRDAAFQQMIGKSQKFTEVTVFYAFRRDLGPDHIYNSIIDTVAGYESAPHMLVSEVVLQIIANFTEQRRQQVLSRHHSSRDARRNAYLAALDKTYERVRPFQVSAAVTRCRAMARRVLDPTTQRTYTDFTEAEQDLAAADQEEAREREEHFSLDSSGKWEWILANSTEGRQSIEAHMRHFDMMNGASSSSGLGNLTPTLPTSLEDMSYRSPDDMNGINWLIEYCTYRSGGFSREDIAQLRAEQMGPNETPRQAAARLRRHASVLAKAGLPGYDQDFEVWSILTTRDREGGAFVTTTLFDHINALVQMALNTNGLQHDSGPLAIQLWIDIADQQFTIIRGSNKSLYDNIIQEAQRRKNSNKDKSDAKADAKGDDKSDRKASDKSAGTGNGNAENDERKGPNMDQDAGQFWCNEHGYNKSHGTAECRTLLERQRKAQNDYEEATMALTTISPLGADLATKGQQPNALYQQVPAPPSGHHPDVSEKVQCPTCTRIAGKPIWHYPSTCYLAPGTTVPASFQPTDLPRLKIVNEKRVAQGLPPWDAPRPMAPRAPIAMPIVANDPTVSTSTETRLTCCMIKPPSTGLNSYLTPFAGTSSLGSARPTPDEEDRLRAFSDVLQYTATTKRFFCKVCRQDCGVSRDPKSGDLASVSCVRCNQTWPAEELPFSWASPSQWRSDGTLLASLMASPVRTSSRGRPVPPASKMLASLVPLGPYGPTPAQVMASSVSSNAPSTVQQPDLTSRRLQVSGTALPAAAASPSPGAPHAKLKPSQFPFKCPSDRLTFGGILLDIEEQGVNLQPKETHRILGTLDAPSRAYHEARLRNSERIFDESRLQTNPVNLTPSVPSGSGPSAANVSTLPADRPEPTNMSGSAVFGSTFGTDPTSVPEGVFTTSLQPDEPASASISFGQGMGGASWQPSRGAVPIVTTPDHTARTHAANEAEASQDDQHDDTYERLTDTLNDNPYEYVPRTEFETEQLERLSLGRRVRLAEDGLRTVQDATSSLLANKPISLMDERFNRWTSLTAELNTRTLALCNATGVDPCGTILGSRLDQIDQHISALRSKVTAYEQHPLSLPTFSQVLSSPTVRPTDDDTKALVAEAELRLRSALATSQAVDQVAKAADTAGSDLRKFRAECRQEFQTLSDDFASLREKVSSQEVAQATMKATYSGLQAQGALARAYVNSSPEPASSSVTFDEVDKLRKQLESLHVTDLRGKVDSLEGDLRQQVADLQVPGLQHKLDTLDSDIRKQVNDLAQEVARINDKLQKAAAKVPAAPSATTSGALDEPRVPYNAPSSEQFAPTHAAVNPTLASAALESTQHSVSRASTPRTLTPPASSGREVRLDDARAGTTPKRLRPDVQTLLVTGRTALPADSDSVGGTSTEVDNALALGAGSHASSDTSPTLGLPPDQSIQDGSSRIPKSPRVSVGMIKVGSPRDADCPHLCMMARTVAELTAPTWGHPDWDALSTDESVPSPRNQGAVCPVGVTTALAQQADCGVSDSSSDTVVTEIGVMMDAESVPELRRFSPGELAELTALLKDETPDEEYDRIRKQLRIATQGLPPGSIEQAIAINAVLAPGTSLAAPPRPMSDGPVVAPAAVSTDVSSSTEGSSTSSHSGDTDEPLPEAASAPEEASLSRKSKRNRASKRRRHARHTALGQVPAALEPRAPPHISSRMGETFCRTPQEEEAYQKFFGHEATSIMVDQSNCQAGFHLLNASQTAHIQPRLVMIDNGADLSVLISPRIARELNVTWTPGSANLYGIGGPSAGHSHADKGQQVVLRLGHFTGPRCVGPWEGCHIVAYRPIIMSESTAADIGCDVIFGQKAMRTCLASVDPFRETLDFSPAWYSHGCAAFRCSIPVQMARPISAERRERQAQAMHWLSVLPSGNADWDDESFDGRLVLPMSAESPPSGSAAAATAGSSNPPTVSGNIPRRPVSVEKHPNALPRQGNGPEAIRAAAAHPHPGFPQTADVPSREQMAEVRKHRRRRSRRNAAEAERRVAEAQVRTAERLSNVVPPAIIGYPVKELQASGRLLDGFRLDLSGGATFTPEQTETIIEAILPKLMEVLAKNAKQLTEAARRSSGSSTDSTSSVSSGRTVWPLASSSSGSARNGRPVPAAAPSPATPAPAATTSAAAPAPVSPAAPAAPPATVPSSEAAPAPQPATRRNPPREGRPKGPMRDEPDIGVAALPIRRSPYGVDNDWLVQSGFAANTVRPQQPKPQPSHGGRGKRVKGRVLQCFGLTVPPVSAVRAALATVLTTMPMTVSATPLGDAPTFSASLTASDVGLMLAVLGALGALAAATRSLLGTSTARRSFDRWVVAPLAVAVGVATCLNPFWLAHAWQRSRDAGWAAPLVSTVFCLVFVFALVWRERRSALVLRALAT